MPVSNELKQIRATHTEQAAALKGIVVPEADSEAQSPLHSLDFEIKRKTISNLELEVAALRRSASHPHLDGARVIVEFDRAVVSNLEVSPGDRVDRGYPLLRLFDLTAVVVERTWRRNSSETSVWETPSRSFLWRIRVWNSTEPSAESPAWPSTEVASRSYR